MEGKKYKEKIFDEFIFESDERGVSISLNGIPLDCIESVIIEITPNVLALKLKQDERENILVQRRKIHHENFSIKIK